MAYIRSLELPTMRELETDDVNEILNAGMDILKPAVKANLARVIKGISEASMPEAKKAKLADNISVTYGTYKGKRCATLSFKGKVKRANVKKEGNNDVRRDLVASVLEFGKKGQPPTHFLRDANNSKKAEIDRAIQNKFNEIINR